MLILGSLASLSLYDIRKYEKLLSNKAIFFNKKFFMLKYAFKSNTRF